MYPLNLLIYRLIIKALLLSSAALVFTCACCARTPLNLPRRITTHPAVDRDPALSPDGKWLAFASDRAGSWDIFLKPVSGGASVRLTSDLSDERSPAWSPEGKYIAFVSDKEDALGDIWVMKVSLRGAPKAGKVRKITAYMGYDDQPVFAPDGKGICFVSDRSGGKEIWYADKKGRDIRRITEGGGISPDISSDGKLTYIRISEDIPNGEVFISPDYSHPAPPLQVTFSNMLTTSPAFNPAGEALAVSRIVRDTDGDGVLSFNDNHTIWIVPLKPDSSGYQSEFQLTKESESCLQTFWGGDGGVYYTYLQGDAADICRLDQGGYFVMKDSPAAQLSAAEEYRDDPQSFLLGLEAVKGYFPAAPQAAWALYYKGGIFADMGFYSTAESYFKRVIRDFEDMRELSFLAQIGHLKVVSGCHLDKFGSIGTISNPTGFITALEDLIESFPEETPLVNALLLKGNALFQVGVLSEAVEIYDHIIVNHPKFTGICAEAQFHKAEVFVRYGDRSESAQAFLQVLEGYPEQEDWNRLAVNRILELEAGEDGFAGLQRLMGRYRRYPRLTGWAKLKMARGLMSQNQNELALQEYSTLLEWPGDDPLTATLRATASFEAAELNINMGDFLSGVEILEKLIDRSSRFKDEALDRLHSAYFIRGSELLKTGDYELSIAAFNRARNIKSGDLSGHRQYIEAMNRDGRGAEVYREYAAVNAAEPDNPVPAYCKGLALSHIGVSDPVKLEKSNDLILKALALDYTMIPAYLTLSYNYQAIEELNRSGKVEIPFLRKAYRSTAEVMSDFWRAMTFRGEPQALSGYENAISALTQALALNDEKSDPAMEARLIRNLGNNFYALGEFGFKFAFQSYLQMLEYSPAFENPQAEAAVYERIGRSAMFTDRFKEGRRFLKSSKEIYQSLGDERSVFRLSLLQAELELRAGDGETSNEYFNQALKQAELADLQIPQELYFSNIAFNWYQAGNWEQALEAVDAALAGLPEGEIPRLPKQSYKIGFTIFAVPFPLSLPLPAGNLGAGSSRMSEGLALADIKSLSLAIESDALYEQGDFLEAEETLREKLKLAEFKKDKWESAVCLNNLGLLSFQKGDYPQAAEYFLQSAEVSRKIRSQIGLFINTANLQLLRDILPDDYPGHQKLNSVIRKTVASIQKTGIETPAGKVLAKQKALILSTEAERVFNSGCAMLNSGEVDSLVSGYFIIQQAGDFWDNSLKLLDEKERSPVSLMIEANLTVVSAIMGEAKYGAGRLKNLSDTAQELGYNDLVWRLKFLQGEMLSVYGDIGAAERVWMEAMRSLEGLIPRKRRQHPLVENSRKSLYRKLVELNLDNGESGQAFMLAERAAGLTVMELMARREFELKSESRKFYWSGGAGSINYFRREISRLQAEIRRPKLKPQEKAALKKQLNDIRTEYSKTRSKVQGDDREFAALFSVCPPELDTIRSNLKANEVLLRFFELDSAYILWAVSREDFTTFNLPFGRETVENLLADLSLGDSAGFAAADRLSEILLSPLQDILDFYSSLLIVPEGAVRKVPFEFLPWREKPLCENYQVRYGPSAAYFHFARGKRMVPGKRVVCLGDCESLKEIPGGFDVIPATSIQSEDDFFRYLAEADYAVVKADFSLDVYPALNSGFRLPGPNADTTNIRLFRIFAHDFPLALIILDNAGLEGNGAVATLTSLCIGGAGSVAAINPSADREQVNVYYRELFNNLNENSPLEAHRRALLKADAAVPQAIYPAASFFGDGGLTPQQEAEFARKNFSSVVLLGNRNLQRGDYEWAGRYYRQAMEMAQRLNDDRAQGMLLQLQLKTAFSSGDWAEAAQIQTKIIERGLTNEAEAAARADLSHFLFNAGSADAAAIQAEASAELYSQAGDWVKAAASLRNFAFLMERGGDYIGAEKFAGAARNLQRQAGLSDTITTDLFRGKMLLNAGLPREAAEVLKPLVESGALSNHNLSIACQFLGRCAERMVDYFPALDYFRRAFDSAPLDSTNTRAAAAQGISDIYYRLGDYGKALEYVLLVRSLSAGGEGEPGLYLNYNTEGLIHLDMGRRALAEKALLKSLELNEATSDRASEANIRKNLARMYIEIGDHTRALFHTRRALEIDRQTGSVSSQAFDRLIMAGLLIKTGSLPSAEAELSAAEELNHELNDIRVSLKISLGRAQLELKAGKVQEASQRLQTALPLAEELGEPAFLWRITYLQGMVQKRMGKVDEALDYCKQAAEIASNSIASKDSWETRTIFLDNRFAPFEAAVKTLIENNKPIVALSLAEESRALRMKRQLFHRGVTLRSGRDYAEEERNLRSKMEAFARKAAAANAGGENEADSERVAENLRSTRERYDRLKMEIQSKDPGLYDLLFYQMPNIGSVQSALDEKTAILYFYTGENDIFGWSVMKDTISVVKIKSSPVELSARIASFNQLIQGSLNAERQGRSLYDAVMGPFESEIADVERLIILPDGSIKGLAFDALLDPGGRYCIDRWEITYSPCLKRVIRSDETHLEKGVALFADPSHPGASGLIFARREAESIAFTIPQSEVHFGAEVTIANVARAIHTMGVVHLSCHGRGDDDTGLDYALLLTPKGDDDGLLTARRIFGMESRAELIFMSACGKNPSGFTPVNDLDMSAALLSAGAGAVAVSLWKVDDLAAGVLAKRFYRGLLKGDSFGEALRRAKLFVRDEINPHPAFWSAFIICGKGGAKLNSKHFSNVLK